ncbi:MAG: radical SAM protein [Planctomycetes bacterium]|nr:radical SAM protein [Planctomycetota bacterium]
MSRILLISTNTQMTPYAVYPLGMATAAGALEAAGHQVRQFDWLAMQQDLRRLRNALQEFAPEVVAVSIRNIDHVDSTATFEDTWELEEARKVVTEIRRLTTVPVLIGGPAVSVMPALILDYVGGDMALPGEAESSIVQVIQALGKSESSMPRIWTGASAWINGDQQSAPVYEPSLVSYYWNASGIMGLQTKRGCPYHCCYCTYPEIEGRHFRMRSVEAVLNDLERLKRDFQVDTVYFADSVFNDPNGYYLELVEALASRQLGIRWAAFFSPLGLTPQIVTLCKKAGLYAVELGTDAASDTTLQQMGKPFLWSDVQRANQLFGQARVACAHFVIFGGPGETKDTVDEGIANIATLDHCVVFGFSGIRIYPKTPLHEKVLAEGLLRDTDSLFKPVYYFARGLDEVSMNQALNDAWTHRADRIFPPHEGQRSALSLRASGWKGLLWENLIDLSRA